MRAGYHEVILLRAGYHDEILMRAGRHEVILMRPWCHEVILMRAGYHGVVLLRAGYHDEILMRAGRHEVIYQYVSISICLWSSFLYNNTNDTITTPVSDTKNSTFFEARDNQATAFWVFKFLAWFRRFGGKCCFHQQCETVHWGWFTTLKQIQSPWTFRLHFLQKFHKPSLYYQRP